MSSLHSTPMHSNEDSRASNNTSSSRRKFSLPLFRTKQECEKEAMEFASHYMIIFEEMMNNEDARRVFKQFLKEEAHNEEPLNFLEDLKVYEKEFKKSNEYFLQDDSQISSTTFKSITKLYHKAHKLINKYVNFHGQSELNLGHSQNITLRDWNRIQYLMQLITSTQEETSVDTTGSPPTSPKSPRTPTSPTAIFFPVSPASTPSGTHKSEQNQSKNHSKRIIYNRDLVRQMMEVLDPKQLFESCKVNVNLDLKLDQFPRFTRSQCCHLFLYFNGEAFARSIAVDISKGRNLDVRFRPKDFETQLVTDKDIYFAFSMCEDSPHWDLVYDSKQVKLFHSKANFTFRKDSSSMNLSKSVLILPFPVENVFNAFCHRDFRFKISDRLLPESCSLEYVPPIKSFKTKDPQKELVIDERDELYDSASPPLGIASGFLGFDLKLPLVKKRVCSVSQTCIYDTHAECIVNVGHSTLPLDHSQQYKDFANDKVVIDLHFCSMFFRVNMTTTRLVQVCYVDSKFPLNSQALSQNIITKHAKTIFEKFESAMRLYNKSCNSTQSPNEHHISSSLASDVFKIQQALDDNSRLYPNRSWFKEYESRKKQTVTPSNNEDSVVFPRGHSSHGKSSYL
ncbi:hypothetical protein FDP41_012993 [Naegleria fowleri]|uniref:RGS domain-containing protein n=1 Tax=Naegleria fowleri TaxID=5763 RepID=A0A6A5C2H1_NAEFO|nr:uncharacterized protein FDP41_000866 [Naegleria fowleri]XP_044565918.1 uncharacterized protein FDP41_012993 [Naegleria fowleri]KAF0980088.1 hypothetical protein FDP41_000866 [Naegleria fowleri]KAF0981205.1 hypothetical protein FDP41_012993 [Naegleria fowleri]